MKKQVTSEEVKQVLKNKRLTDKQKLFCIYYVRCFNATKAYQKAYKCSYAVANSKGCVLLAKEHIKKEIDKLKETKLNMLMLKEEDIIQKYIDIAFTDITDYIIFGQEQVPVMTTKGPLIDEKTGIAITKTVNIVKFKESNKVDGSLISEVRQSKSGASIKLEDKMKALEWLSKRMDLLPKDTMEKLKLEKEKFKLTKEKINKNDINTENIDKLVEAINRSEA